ncbi:hypothetical protein SELMODRAFT_424673 [Selaginella moellendorffii]|uniref:Uncharacterized protein n=1 Tax=Selaginella moellendorffii TaxID=88036 RepID=D8SQP3_SELML|nr:hypothetical protein SELMODRAFT_424673 [Selaginella moellendorffii]
MVDGEALGRAFVQRTPEKWELNQYWYSAATIAAIVKEVEERATKAAFLSTPSVYFSLKDLQLRKCSFVFDVDAQWSRSPNYVKWDFNKPKEIPEAFHHSFDFVVIDPPFITSEVWTKYAEAARLLLAENGKILLSTIMENSQLLERMLDVKPQVFQPCIPHLVYQALEKDVRHPHDNVAKFEGHFAIPTEEQVG